MGAPHAPLAERLWRKVDKDGPIPEFAPHLGPCWLWTGVLSNGGYGSIGAGGSSIKKLLTHRVAYEVAVGPIPEGLQLDHLCRVRSCVRPSHLEPVTKRENILRGDSPSARAARKTHCVNGHPLTDDNVVHRDRGAGRLAYMQAVRP